MRTIFYGIFTLLTASLSLINLKAACVGKIDVGPAFLHVDILESGHTVKRMDMWGGRVDASYTIWKGLFVKPTFLYGNGGAAKGGLCSASFGLGFYTPVMDCLAISPLLGITYSHVWTKIDIPLLMLTNLREKFVAWAPYLGFEICYTITKGLRINGSFQYAWSRTHTTISKLPPSLRKTKSNSKGPTYSILIEKDLSDCWSINFGAAYNLGLTKERHGLRATGVKIGAAYWF